MRVRDRDRCGIGRGERSDPRLDLVRCELRRGPVPQRTVRPPVVVVQVKGNQPTLHEGIVEFFLDQMEDDFVRVKVSRHETEEKGHGRIEHRTYYVCDVPDDLPDASRWAGLKRIGVAISDTVRSGKPCDDVRYYILSKKMSASSFGAAVRSHWSIENSLHWQLDMSFGEDRSRVRKWTSPRMAGAGVRA